jgi:hypothetical protein
MAPGSYGATGLVARRLALLETSEEGSTNASAGCAVTRRSGSSTDLNELNRTIRMRASMLEISRFHQAMLDRVA